MLETLHKLFFNFQYNKLYIVNPDSVNLLILSIFAVLVLLSTKKNTYYSSEILNKDQTEQLKGLAIFFVVLGHLWVHVSKSPARMVFSNDAVSMFLMFSGFGLAMSLRHKELNLMSFWRKRIDKVMVPYWIVTCIVLICDSVILGKNLPLDNLIMTLFGINIITELRHLDYVRWFITFILLWYIVFFIEHLVIRNKLALFCIMLLFAFVLLPFHYYVLDIGWYQFCSFPIGYLCAISYPKLQKIFCDKKNVCIFVSLIGLGYVLAYKFIMGNEIIYDRVTKVVPNIIISYIREFNSLIFNGAIILLSGYIFKKGFTSSLLHFLGKYSYEIFLLHGVFLIKYNPFFWDSGTSAIVVNFFVFLSFITMLSLIFSKISLFIDTVPRFIYVKITKNLLNE